jgi:ATP-dependent RNA helicase RhlE
VTFAGLKEQHMRFNEYPLAPELIATITDMGFKRPTDIQHKAITPILNHEDVLAVAQTGTGKTAAYAIPLVQDAITWKERATRPDGVRSIVLVPTHELAMQVVEVFEKLSKLSQVKAIGIYGGVDQEPQIAGLKTWVDIVVATPGRMFDLIAQGHLRLNRVRTVVLDEADHMLKLGFLQDIRDLSRKLPERRQTLFFSATIDQEIKKLAYSLIKKSAIRIRISPKDPVSRNVTHAVGFVEMDDKRFFLERLYHDHSDSKMLVFVRSKVRAERVSKAMGRVEIPSQTIHSDKTQDERTEALRQFKDNEVRMLIATDVTARGIDIPEVQWVVNYDLPDQAENYVHRVGRTGRGNHRGQAISFCSKEEREKLKAVEDYIGKRIDKLEISKSDMEDVRLLSDDGDDVQSMLKEIEAFDEKQRKKKKTRKSKG